MSRAKGEDQFNRKRLRYSYLSVIVSIGLVLFVLGVMMTLLYQARTLTDELKENFTFTLFLQPETTTAQREALVTTWSMSPEVRQIIYVSKEGEDFVDFLGYNPLSDALDLKLNADFVTPEVLEDLKARLMKESIVEDMVYDRALISAIHKNIGRITSAMLAAAVVLLLVSMALINSSIRLAIYARRFSIKTMQLVGATKAFIHRPFLRQGLRLGLFGGLFAAVLLGFLFQSIRQVYPELATSLPWTLWLMEVVAMTLVGLILTATSTALAVRRYLALKTNQLYE
jgi:cell division transport system permease protein